MGWVKTIGRIQFFWTNEGRGALFSDAEGVGGRIFRSGKRGNVYIFFKSLLSKVLPWPFYPIQSNMGQIFYPIWMNPDRRCVGSPMWQAGHCFLSMC